MRGKAVSGWMGTRLEFRVKNGHINELFTPTPEALAHAQAIADAFAANPDAGVVGIGGVMVDRQHLARAQRTLARATTTKT